MCHHGSSEDEHFTTEDGRPLFTSRDMLVVARALGHTNGNPEDEAEREKLMRIATQDYHLHQRRQPA